MGHINLVLLLLLCYFSGCSLAYRSLLEVPAEAIALNTTEGVNILTSSRTVAKPYWKTVALHFVTQLSQAYCAIASSVIVLNGLELSRGSAPVDPLYSPYPYWTQDNILNNCTNDVVTPFFISTHGVTMDQLAGILACHNVSAQVVYSNETTLEQFRKTIESKMVSGNPVLLNFHRPELSEHGGGHWSPVVAYSIGHDRALLADVSRYKYPPTWVLIAELYNASLTIDHTAGKYRGMVLVTDTDPNIAPYSDSSNGGSSFSVTTAIFAVVFIASLFFLSLCFKIHRTYFTDSSMYSNLRTSEREEGRRGRRTKAAYGELNVGACGIDDPTEGTVNHPLQKLQDRSKSGVIRFDDDEETL
jgi:hypothetical protein